MPHKGGLKGWPFANIASLTVHGAIALVLINTYGDFLATQGEAEQVNPTFVITLDQLDSDTLAGILEREGAAGGDDGTDVEPSTLEPVPVEEELEDPGVENAEAVVPEPASAVEPEVAEVEEPEALPVEEVAELEPEAPELAEPEAVEAIAPEAQTIAALETEALQPLSPILPDPTELSPVVLDNVAAVPTNGGDSGFVPVDPAFSQPVANTDADIIASLSETPSEIISTAPANPVVVASSASAVVVGATPSQGRTPPTPRAPPSAQDIAIRDLLIRIRSADPVACLIALPRRDGPEGIGIALVAARDGVMEAFSTGVFGAEDADIRQTRTLIDPRQCAALELVRANKDYPATRLGIQIDQVEVASGDRLTGVIRGVAGRYVTVLIIDDNGVVQDLQRFLSFSGNLVRFDVPVTRAGNPRDSSQIILAIAGKTAPGKVLENMGQFAEVVFSEAALEQVKETGLAFATFDVR